MKTITFNIQKGGTGKTSLSLATAYELANYGKVCIVDLDPQGNATDILRVSTLYEIADGYIRGIDAKEILQPTSRENLYIMPTASIGNLGAITQKLDAKSLLSLFSDLVNMGFDYAIIDTPPAVDQYTKTIISICDEVITPLVCDNYSISGMIIFNKTLAEIRKENTRVKYNKIVLNKLDKRASATNQFKEQIKKTFDQFEFYEIGTSQEFTNAQFKHEFVNTSLNKESLQEIKRLANDIK